MVNKQKEKQYPFAFWQIYMSFHPNRRPNTYELGIFFFYKNH